PLLDVTQAVVGAVELTFPYPPGSGFDEDGLIRAAQKIRDEMSRRILDADSLAQPLRLDARIPVGTRAQALVDDVLIRHPEVEIVAIHARLPGDGQDAPIVASNMGRIGKPADGGDLAVIQTGQPHVEADPKGARVEAKLPLLDATGATVGALAIVFPMRAVPD